MRVVIMGGGPTSLAVLEQLRGKFTITLISDFQANASHLGDINLEKYGSLSGIGEEFEENVMVIVLTRTDKLGKQQYSNFIQDCKFLARSQANFLNVSSVSVYGSNIEARRENSDPFPLSDYAKAKLRFEKDLLSFKTNGKVTNLRVSNLFGRIEYVDVINKMIHSVENQQLIELPIIECKRDFVHVKHLVNFIEMYLGGNLNLPEYLNFASGVSVELGELGSTIADLLGKDLRFNRSRSENLTYSIINNSLLARFYDMPELSFMHDLECYVSLIKAKV